ncbi:MAG: response regulator [Candidatus Omnitrophica bacterium]|nr:response regulator [Candidatus Omnitrophota bacterium]MBI2173976.1 response regulator [Candidatus Omnitrophota bacterium]MBI3009727.1 response regulator [Candidatus Omnitrophota bacterium]
MTSTNGHILVVEDDRKLAEVLKQRLAFAGYDIHTEETGNTAIQYAVAHRPDLVILDLRLPDIGGFDVCRELRKHYTRWDVPILMLTGMDRPVDQLRGFAHGADAYLTKPYEPNELMNTISCLLGESSAAT